VAAGADRREVKDETYTSALPQLAGNAFVRQTETASKGVQK
jgi:hypothetical protein